MPRRQRGQRWPAADAIVGGVCGGGVIAPPREIDVAFSGTYLFDGHRWTPHRPEALPTVAEPWLLMDVRSITPDNPADRAAEQRDVSASGQNLKLAVMNSDGPPAPAGRGQAAYSARISPLFNLYFGW
jgi:hypothetical protein